MREKINVNVFLFYNGYKLGRRLFFIWPLNINNSEF